MLQVITKPGVFFISKSFYRYALNGVPYKIFLFIGHPIQDRTASFEMEYYVGSVYTFSSNINRPAEGQCQNCLNQKQQGILSSATIPITDALTSRVGQNGDGLVSLRPEDVLNYLESRPLKFLVADGCANVS